MIALAASGFGFLALADKPGFQAIARQFDHVAWEGAVFWDLIQPAFMFMVGVAMPFALARRIRQGATFRQNLWHVTVRAFRLFLLSQILSDISGNKLHFQLINVLSQMAFTYLFAFLIMQLSFRKQAIVAALILAGHWALFALFPGPDGAFSKDQNIGALIDRTVLGFNYSGLYVTINFITSTVTTLFGVWAGMLLRTRKSDAAKTQDSGGMRGGGVRDGASSFAVEPAGQAPLDVVVHAVQHRLGAADADRVLLADRGEGLPEVGVPAGGRGDEFDLHLLAGPIMRGGIDRAVAVFTFRYTWIGTLAPVAQACTVLLVMWYMCYWLYQRKIFFKL